MSEVIYGPKGRAAEYSFKAINHYRGCGHGCKYCYGPIVTHNKRFFTEQSVRNDILKKVRREAPKHAGTDERVLLSFISDPYQPLDETTQTTREIIKILREFDIPFQVLTKGGLRATRDFDLYGPKDAFAVTLTLMNYKWKQWEPNADAPFNRIAALNSARERGIETWVSLEPVIDIAQTLHIIKHTESFVDLYKIGKLNYLKSKIDWHDFGARVIELCEYLGKPYFIKSDLTKYLKGIPFTNTDNRKSNWNIKNVFTKSDGRN